MFMYYRYLKLKNRINIPVYIFIVSIEHKIYFKSVWAMCAISKLNFKRTNALNINYYDKLNYLLNSQFWPSSRP